MTAAMKAHPVADLFPMLAADELAELAADIKARGQLQPIVLDPDGRILDGRNRLAACELAGVDPMFETYDGDDPGGYALAVNATRRNLRPSQRYVVMEQARRLTEIKKSYFSDTIKVQLSQAATVLDYAPDLAEAVVAGAMSLDSAAQVARDRKREAAEIKAKRQRLRVDARDLADLVDDERMSVDDAIAALDAREQKARQDAAAAKREAEERASEEERQRQALEQERQESLNRDRDRIRMVVSGWSTVRNILLAQPDSDLAAEIVAGLGDTDRAALHQILAEVRNQEAYA